jgi:capsular exopolysaccharide synthesis family protein
MTNEAASWADTNEEQATSNVVHSLVRFLWLLRRRKSVVFTAMAIAGMLGAIYFVSATRIYRAKAQVLVMQSTSGTQVEVSTGRSAQDQIETFQRLFTSRIVLESALKQIPKLPPEISESDSLERAIDTLRGMLRTSTLRRTSIIEVSCLSESPQSSVQLVNAVVKSYIEYIDKNHSSVTRDVIADLNRERVVLQDQLSKQEVELQEARRQSADLGIGEGSGAVHPLVQNVIALNESVASIRQKRVKLEASLTSLRDAVVRGGDLRQHFSAVEPVVGKELLLSALGVNSHEAQAMQEEQRGILSQQAKLKTLANYYGANHPEVAQIRQRIQASQTFIASIQTRFDEQLTGSKQVELGTMLTRLLEEELARAVEQERQLAQEYAVAETQAILHNDLVAQRMIIERKVQQTRDLFATLNERIGTIEINQGQNDVRADIVTTPMLPEEPVSPQALQVLLMSGLLGIGIGSLAVYVLDVVDDRFRSPEELQEQLGVPVLAMVRKHAPLVGEGMQTLQVFRAPDAVESEAFRTLRTTLAFSGQEFRRIVVTSSEPADGKTTVLSNLGVSFAQSGSRTLLIDCDLRRPGLTNLFGMRANEGVSEVLRSSDDLDSLVADKIQPLEQENLYVLPAGRRPFDSAELLGRDRFSDLLAWAETKYDQILIDSPPVLAAADAAITGRLVDGMLLVVQPDKNHRRSVIRAVEGVNAFECNLLGTVVNAVSEEDGASYYGYGGYGYGYSEGYGETFEEEETQDVVLHDDELPATVPMNIESMTSTASPTSGDVSDSDDDDAADSWFNWKQSA